MERKVESGIKCINQADKLLSIFRSKYIELQEDKKDMSAEELNDNERLLGSQFGLICEYYLKGLWLPCVRERTRAMSITGNRAPQNSEAMPLEKATGMKPAQVINVPVSIGFAADSQA